MEGLKNILDKRGIKYSWLANELEVNPSAVTRWINGESKPNKATRYYIAHLLGCNMVDLI